MICLSHPTGNANVRAVLQALHRAQKDYAFYTSLALTGKEWFMQMAPAGIRNELARRTYDLPSHRMRSRPLRELCRLSIGRVLPRLTAHEIGWASVDAIYQDLDRYVAKEIERGLPMHGGDLAYCYEDCAFDTFKAAKKTGLQCWYDLPIAYWETAQRLLREEAQRLPHWEPTLGGTRDSDEKLERKAGELSQADVVVCPSQFVYDSLPESIRERKQCIVAEFGSPVVNNDSARSENKGQPFRILFAGALTQRKGLADLFAAIRILGRRDIELVVMGSLAAPMKFYRSEFNAFTYEPPRPHHKVLELMQSCDVFVLPSIVEGRALVQQEALSCGLPLIVTRNAGGEDLVEEGRTGFIVPIRAPEAIAEKLAWFADHRNDLPAMREAARDKAREYTWERYGTKIIDAMSGHRELAHT